MRILVAIPHFFGTETSVTKVIGSKRKDPRPRQEALTECIKALHHLFHPAQRIIHSDTRRTADCNTSSKATKLDVIVVTTGSQHLINALPVGDAAFTHRATDTDPAMLGFECHSVLASHANEYDWYCYLEDDLVVRDSQFFTKLAWFNSQFGDEYLLMPNRFEVGDNPRVYKAYVDGNLASKWTDGFRKPAAESTLSARIMNGEVSFGTSSNPHAGCFFLTATQLAIWRGSKEFGDRNTSFIGPLESAATFSVGRQFSIVKPAIKNASFFEIQHFGDQFIRQLRPG